MLEAAIFVVFPFCMAFAAISDMLSMTIANRVSIVLILTFAVVAPLTGMDWSAFGLHLAAGAIVLAITFVLFAIGGMGGGDAKLLAATSVWMGLGMPLLEYLVYASMIGGLLTLFVLSYRKSIFHAFLGQNMFLRHFAEDQKGIPYGIALGVGGMLAFPDSPLVLWALGKAVGQ
jgi:prepilin peptidase CpaA